MPKPATRAKLLAVKERKARLIHECTNPAILEFRERMEAVRRNFDIRTHFAREIVQFLDSRDIRIPNAYAVLCQLPQVMVEYAFLGSLDEPIPDDPFLAGNLLLPTSFLGSEEIGEEDNHIAETYYIDIINNTGKHDRYYQHLNALHHRVEQQVLHHPKPKHRSIAGELKARELIRRLYGRAVLRQYLKDRIVKYKTPSGRTFTVSSGGVHNEAGKRVCYSIDEDVPLAADKFVIYLTTVKTGLVEQYERDIYQTVETALAVET